MTCQTCGKRSYSEFCVTHKPRKALARTALKPRTKAVKKTGKHYDKWREFREQWHKDNPGPHACHICRLPIRQGEVTLDHVIPRSNSPELRYNNSNIKPAHFVCNGIKGSKSIDKIANIV